jgi:hypothetical protein
MGMWTRNTLLWIIEQNDPQERRGEARVALDETQVAPNALVGLSDLTHIWTCWGLEGQLGLRGNLTKRGPLQVFWRTSVAAAARGKFGASQHDQGCDETANRRVTEY